MERFDERNSILIGTNGQATLAKASVAVFGLGGVGGACALDLVRSGIGTLWILDYDQVSMSNLNRLAYGYSWNVGKAKVDAFRQSALAINPDLKIELCTFLLGKDADWTKMPTVDFYIDAIDTLNAKVCAIEWLVRQQKKFISATGTGGRLRPDLLRYGNLWTVTGDSLARELRNRLRRRTVLEKIPCIWSMEPALEPAELTDAEIIQHQERKLKHSSLAEGIAPGRLRRRQGTMPFVPQTAGHLLASYAVHFLLGLDLPLTE